jgi:4-hydroxy-tetrahydrodipicolinate reductase
MSSVSLGVVGDRGRFGSAVVRHAMDSSVPVVLRANRSGWTENARPDVLLDVSSPQGLASSIEYCRRRQVALLVGTSGLSSLDVEQLRDLARDVAVCAVANFSLVHHIQRLLVRVTAQFCERAGAAPVAHVVDRHPPWKQDRPSATANVLADEWTGPTKGERPSVDSVRCGLPVADHTFELAFDGELLSIVHSVHGRNGPARTALVVAARLATKAPGHYDDETMFDELLRMPTTRH